MAFSAVTERGSATERALDGSIAASPLANITVGKIAFVYAVADNIATTTGASTDMSIADTDGHTWIKAFERTYAPTAAAEVGATHALWFTLVSTQIDTTDAITLTLSTNAVAKVLMVFECTITGSTVQVADDGIASAFQESTTATPSVATSGMTSQEYLHIGAMAVEDETLTWTEDADYTNVFASEGVSSGPAGGAASNVTGFLGYRIATLTGDTFAPSYGASRDIAIALVAFEEVAGGTTFFITPGGSITGTGTLARQTNKGLSGTATGSGTVSKLASKFLTGTSTGSGVVANVKIVLLNMAGTITAAGDLAKTAVKILVGSLTAAGSTTKTTAKTISGSTTPQGVLATIKLAILNIAGSITVTGNLIRTVAKNLAGSITGSGTVTKTTSKTLDGNVTPTGALAKLTSKLLSGAVTASGMLSLLTSGAASLFRRLEGAFTVGRQEGGHTTGRQDGSQTVDRQEGNFE